MTDSTLGPMALPPWRHQHEDYLASRDLPAAALPWPPRLGKTKITFDTFHWLRERGEVDTLLVLAPNGVHLNWTRDQLPLHWVGPQPLVVEWEAAKVTQKGYQAKLKAALEHDGPLVVAVNLEAVATPKAVNLTCRGGMGWLERLVKRRKVLLAVDEAHGIKNPTARRTRAVHKLAPFCPYRRTLTGTPVAQGPFDLWAQYHALDPVVLGHSFPKFRAKYAVFKKNRVVVCPKCKTQDDYQERRRGKDRFLKCGACGHSFPVFAPLFDELVEYRNLDELNERIAPITFPRRKEDCLDLPERLFSREYFEMPSEHRRIYEDLRKNLLARLEGDETITAPSALVNLLRLQQVSRGHVTLEDRTVRSLGEPYPAAERALQLVQENAGKSIVWCRFRPDVDLLEKVFTAAGLRGIRCDGGTPSEERPGLLQRFRDDPDQRYWLGTLATGGVGVDLGAADLMVFYSHGWDLVQRLQGLERNYGSSQKAERLAVVDLVAANTADERALAALERKEDLASQLTGRKLKELLE